nr:hypothetical protein [Tanacetum cinerariifolium]
MCNVAEISPQPLQSLIPPSREVNADESAYKSLSETSVPPVTQSKETTARKPRKKTILSLTQPEALNSSRIETSSFSQATHLQPAEEFVVIADEIKVLNTIMEKNVEEKEKAEDHSSNIPTIEQLLDKITKDAEDTLIGSGPIDMDSQTADFEFELELMPDDDLQSLSGFETSVSDSSHDVSHSEHTSWEKEHTPYPILDELKDHCLTLRNASYLHQQYTVYNTLVNEDINTPYPSRKIRYKDNDDDIIDIKQSSRDMSVIPLPNVINTDFGAYKLQEKQLEEEQAAKAQNWKLPVCYDDDDDEERSNSLEDNIISGLPPCSEITPNEPVLSTEEPDNSLSMGDEHLDTIPTTELDEFIKSSVENLIPILNQFEDFSESNDEFSSPGDDSFSIDNIDYVEASPTDSELVSSEVMEIVIPEVGGIDDDILLTYKDDILCENLLNANHLFAKIEALNDNPITFYDPIISGTPSTLTPSGESDFFFDEVDAFLAVEDEPISSQFPQSYLDPEGDILLLEAFLNDDHSSDFKTNSSSTSLNSLLEETNNFDNSLYEFTTFLSVLFDAEYESDSSDDQSCSDEDVLEKIVLKPLFEEEIIPMKIDLHPDNAESDLLESLRTHDSSLLISSKIDSLFDEFADELSLLKSIPPGIDETDCDPKEDIRLIEKLLYDNSSPRPPEEFVSANSNAEIESFSLSPIPVKDSDSLMQEINYLDFPSNDTLSIHETESFHFDILSFSHPPAKPPDGNTGILNIKMMGDISDQKAFMHKLMITLASDQEKSLDLLSHRSLKAIQPFATCPMMIHGQNNHILDVLLFHFYPL